MSHELRTPLTSIVGSLRLLTEGVAGADPENSATLLDIAWRNSGFLAEIINDILNVEKLDASAMQFQIQKLDLTELIERAVDLNSGFAEEHGVRFEFVDPGCKIKVRGDDTKLLQVMANLLLMPPTFPQTAGA